MLRKRSRSVTSKQSIVGDQISNNPWLPPEKPTKPTSFFLNSPRFFKNLFTCTNNSDQMMSPTSILDKNPFSVVANFWVFDNKSPKPLPNNTKHQQQHAWEELSHKQGIGLALIDENLETNNNNFPKPETKQQKRKLVVFGSQLRIQVPSLTNSSVFPCFSPESPREFGIKTPRNNLWSPFGNKDPNSQVHPVESIVGNRIIDGNESLSIDDIDEESEDYTCVISHGPNPKTTHIFGNCIVESCCGKIVGSPSFSSKRNGYFSNLENSIPAPDNFLSFCHHCKKKLGEGRDIYMYRGEKAFCSEECRCQEMLFDEVEN
ncbi:FCS-Like Zinc finger 8-like [Silene latifolia]|uniref:FCS-Like Zinc finger 8-like n=1 Tax=Silene latifolia TaxID=37657 RepID=UPI003D7741AB